MARIQSFSSLEDCIRLAEFAHHNQRDQAGSPYIDHPKRVLAAVQAQGAMPYVQMAAILHDVTEDTTFTCDMLLSLGVPEAAVNIVRLVDRDASKKVFDAMVKAGEYEYINDYKSEVDKFYYNQIRSNVGALQVKLADIGDNTQPWRLAYLSEQRQDYLRNKYDKAIRTLRGEAVL